jgi:hypothetical protein
MTLQEAAENIGSKVIYRAEGVGSDVGVITSVNFRWVFVRYGRDAGSKATDPSALVLEAGAS